MVIAASEASLIAQILDYKWSQIPRRLASSTSPVSMLNPLNCFKLADFILLISSLELYPEFSIKILANVSKL